MAAKRVEELFIDLGRRACPYAQRRGHLREPRQRYLDLPRSPTPLHPLHLDRWHATAYLSCVTAVGRSERRCLPPPIPSPPPLPPPPLRPPHIQRWRSPARISYPISHFPFLSRRPAIALSAAMDPGGGDDGRRGAACSCDRAVRAEAALAVSTASAAALRVSLDAALGQAAILTRQLKAAERAAAVATGGALPVSSVADGDGRVADPAALARVPSMQTHGGAGGSGSWSNCSELSQPPRGPPLDMSMVTTTEAAVARTAAAPGSADVEVRSCTAADGLLLLSRAGAASADRDAEVATGLAPTTVRGATAVPAVAVPPPPVARAAAVAGSRAAAAAPVGGAVRKSRSAASTAKRPTASKSRFSSASGPTQSRYWTAEEHARFLEALRRYGHKDLKAIAAAVATRNQTQARTHLQKWLMKIAREARRSEAAAAAAAAANAEVGAAPEGKAHVAPEAARPATAAAAATVATAAPATEAAAAPAAGGGGGNACAVPRTCGMALLCIVGQDTLRV